MEAREYELMDEAEQGMWWYRALHKRVIAALAGVKGRVLDAGCGTGGLLARLEQQRPELALFGAEWAEIGAVRAARKSHAALVRGSVNALPFADESFDAAVTADVLCHAGVDPEAALAELRRVLRPQGRLIVNMPAYAWLLSEHDRRVQNARRQTAGETRRMLAACGFRVLSARYWNGLLLPLMVAQRKILARHDSASDVTRFSPWLDTTLHAMTEVERWLPVAMPAGGSILVIATRP